MDVDNGRCKRFDVADAIAAEVTNEVDEFLDRSESVTDLEIEVFVVVLSEIDEVVCEIVDEIVDEILSFSLLKFRFEASLIIFFVDLT